MKKYILLMPCILFLSPWITYLSSKNIELTGLVTLNQAMDFTIGFQIALSIVFGIIFCFKKIHEYENNK